MKSTKTHIITPAVADETNLLHSGLTGLTQAIAQINPDVVAYGALGGEFGYGAELENDIFMMHPYCWCDESACLWCAIHTFNRTNPTAKDKARRVSQKEQIKAKYGDPKTDHPKAPNFWHKASGFQVRWYKWIGRGMEINNVTVDYQAVFSECLASLSKHT